MFVTLGSAAGWPRDFHREMSMEAVRESSKELVELFVYGAVAPMQGSTK